MTDREKLIELIDMAEDVAEEHCWTEDSCKTCGKKTKDGDKCCTGMMADILIANGVVVREKGEWIPSESDFDDDDTLFDVEEWCDWQCSVCHEDICYEDPMERRWLPKFCPNCGADMRGDAE